MVSFFIWDAFIFGFSRISLKIFRSVEVEKQINQFIWHLKKE